MESMLDSGAADICHVLVPPPLHYAIAKQLIQSDMPLIIEKPMCSNSAQCEELIKLANERNVSLGVNQNAIFFPTFIKLTEALNSGQYGDLKHVECKFMAPLRQLEAGQLGHWMFATPGNMLLEQMVHPLSQLFHLLGEIEDFSFISGKEQVLANGKSFYPSIGLDLAGTKANGHLSFQLGMQDLVWKVSLVCEDGTLEADLVAGILRTNKRTKYLDTLDSFLITFKSGISDIAQATANMSDYVLALLGVKGRSDAFYKSIYSSLEHFYIALASKSKPVIDVSLGANLVRFCENLALRAYKPSDTGSKPKLPPNNIDDSYDVLLIGGTGFIGKHLLARLINQNYKVGVFARNVKNLADEFYHGSIVLIHGSLDNDADLDRAISKATYVVNLAHGGASGSWEAIRDAMVGGAERVAKNCLKHGSKQLIHIGSIASLYLGDEKTINADTLPDPLAQERADYSRAKTEADLALIHMSEKEALPLLIMRPGVVVGRGGIPFHSGIGLFNNTLHCIGWNKGDNPLPFVLVDDVADAILNAIKKEVVGYNFNLVGDIELTAQEYIQELAATVRRPLKFHPQSVLIQYSIEWFKWGVKRIGGRLVPKPSMRDFKSRGMVSHFDCSLEKEVLGWSPESSRMSFIDKGIKCYGDQR